MTRSKISEKLKKAIRESELTQKDIAEILGIEQTQISKWIRGKTQPTLDKFEKLLEVLGKDANYFFENSGSVNQTHSGQGDQLINSTIKKSNKRKIDPEHLLLRIEKLEKLVKSKKKSKIREVLK